MIEFLEKNLVDSSVISASSTNAQFSLNNLKDDRRTKVWRSNTSDATIVIDFGSPEPVDFFMLADNWKNGLGFSTLTLEANDTNEWSAPAFTTSVGINYEYGLVKQSFTSENYRFWRLNMSSSLPYCEVSRFFLGSKSTVTTNGVNYNWTYQSNSLDSKQVNRYGQAFFDRIGNQKLLSGLNFSVMNKDEIDVIHSVDDICSTSKAFFIHFPISETLVTENDRYSGFYRLVSSPSFENTTAGYFSVTLDLEECL